MLWEDMKSYVLENGDVAAHFGWISIKIILLIIISQIFIRVLNRVVNRTVFLNGKLDQRRGKTLSSLFSNFIKYTTYFILIMTILPIFGIQIGALLAGAGVVGITIAFGAQSLIKDFFNGFFILLEDQFGVDDQVRINDISGKVYSVGLRVTSIKMGTGELVYIPNSQITQVTNYSKSNSMAVLSINVGYNTEAEKAIEILKQVMDGLKAENANIVGEVNVNGIQSLNDCNYTLSITAECLPLTHWSVEREARQRIQAAFNKAAVDLPVQKVVYTFDKQTAE